MVTYSQREPQGSQRERGESHAEVNRRPAAGWRERRKENPIPKTT